MVPNRLGLRIMSLFFRLRRPTPCAPIRTRVFLWKGGIFATSSYICSSWRSNSENTRAPLPLPAQTDVKKHALECKTQKLKRYQRLDCIPAFLAVRYIILLFFFPLTVPQSIPDKMNSASVLCAATRGQT